MRLDFAQNDLTRILGLIPNHFTVIWDTLHKLNTLTYHDFYYDENMLFRTLGGDSRVGW